MDGWIKLYRPIREHWIWKDPQKFQWWIDMLLSVNHSTTKVNIGMQLFECERGQSVMSLSSWAKRWNISKDKVRNFFALLEKDHMITHESLGKSTRITICNYDSYQSDLHDSQTMGKQLTNAEQTQSHPNKNDKKENNDKNDKKIIKGAGNKISDYDLSFVDSDFLEIFKYWLEYRKEIKKPYKSQVSLKACYEKLIALSDNNLEKAKAIIDESVANGWAGLFALKEVPGGKTRIQNNQNATGTNYDQKDYSGNFSEKKYSERL